MTCRSVRSFALRLSFWCCALLLISAGLLPAQPEAGPRPESLPDSGMSSTESFATAIETLLSLSEQQVAQMQKQVTISKRSADNSLSLAALLASSTASWPDIMSGIAKLVSSLDQSLATQKQAASSQSQVSTLLSASGTASAQSQAISEKINQVTDQEVQSLGLQLTRWRVAAIIMAVITVASLTIAIIH